MIVLALTAVCVALFALGHVVRDGWPALGSTHAARALGAAFCGFGAIATTRFPWASSAVWLGVWLGFYLDQKHGEGQNAGTAVNSWLVDYGYLTLSGVTSVLLIVALRLFFESLWPAVAVLAVGVLKPVIWFGCLHGIPDGYVPTRWAAGIFGALLGLAVASVQFLPGL